MVIWDTNILALFFGKRLDQDDLLRMHGLISDLKRKREPIGIPAQVWSEFLEAANPEELSESQSIFKTTAFRLLPYDLRAAIENADISRSGRTTRKTTKGPKRERQAVKVDWQIIAVAKVGRAKMLLTNDESMKKEALRSGLQCKSISELSIPDALRQQHIDYSATKLETQPPSAVDEAMP